MTISRRDWLKGAAAGGAAAAVADLFVVQPARAEELKRAGAKEFTTICNFCACGCGMVGHVLDGKLVNLEGDPDHVVNEGSLCVKGSAMLATHESPQRLRTPRYRAPGSDRWVELSWDEALDKLARRLKATRDSTWVATEKDGEKEYQVNRTDALALLGGAQNTNEECYLWTKLGRLLGTNYVEHQARL
jgi:formate dehydrogenase major subunit